MGESLLTGLHGLLRCASIRAAAQARHRVVGGDELRDLVRELILGRQVGSATRRLHVPVWGRRRKLVGALLQRCWWAAREPGSLVAALLVGGA